jgi:hypothetical protein
MEEAGSSEGARKKSADVGVGRLEQTLTGKVGSLGERGGGPHGAVSSAAV